MKQISVREFQLHPTKYLKELPLVLTQYNKPVADLIPHVNTSANTSAGLPLPVLCLFGNFARSKATVLCYL
jgi:hypothetical protein